jgi:hypothetical protein
VEQPAQALEALAPESGQRHEVRIAGRRQRGVGLVACGEALSEERLHLRGERRIHQLVG